MKIFRNRYILLLLPALLIFNLTIAQTADLSSMKKSDILKMSYNDLIELDFPDLLSLADIVGMSTDELLQLAIVSASREEESLIDAPLSASVVTGEMIKRSGATSIPEALRLVPGVIVREQTPGVYDVHLRGMDTPDPNGLVNWTSNSLTLVMVNNRIVYNEYQGNVSWELLQINIDDIQQIEVVKGPAAALYGTNAVTGAINIITKNPNRTDGLQVGTYSQLGTPDLLNTGVSVGYNFDNPFSVRFSGHFEKRKRHNVDYYVMGSQPFDSNGLVPSEIGRATYYDTLQRVGFVPNLNNDYRNVVGGPMVNADVPYINNDPAQGYNYNIDERFPNPEQSINKYSFNGHVNYLKDDVDLNLMGGYSRADAMKVFSINNMTALSTDVANNMFGQLYGSIKNFNINIDYNQGEFESLGAGTALAGSSKIFSSDVMYNWQVTDNFNLKPGVSYRSSSYYGRILGSEGYNYDSVTSIPNKGDITNSTTSAYLRADYHLGKSRIIGALRADKFQYPDKTAISPQLVYTFKATNDILLRASYGRAYRSPFMINLFTDLDMQYEGYLPSEGLQTLSGVREQYGMSPITGIYDIKYKGTEVGYTDMDGNQVKSDYDLMYTDEFEIGARVKVNDWVSFDGEMFYSEYNDLDVFSRVVLATDPITTGDPATDAANLAAYYIGNPLLGTANPAYSNDEFTTSTITSFVSSEVKPVQMGATLSMFGQPSNKFNYNVFITLQKTEIKGYYKKDTITGFVDSSLGTESFTHEATPSYYGGFNFDYRPIDILNINFNGYYYGPQTLRISSGREAIEENVKENILLNATVSYEFYEDMKFFVSARNFGTGQKRQYALSDMIGASYLLGIDIDL